MGDNRLRQIDSDRNLFLGFDSVQATSIRNAPKSALPSSSSVEHKKLLISLLSNLVFGDPNVNAPSHKPSLYLFDGDKFLKKYRNLRIC